MSNLKNAIVIHSARAVIDWEIRLIAALFVLLLDS